MQPNKSSFNHKKASFPKETDEGKIYIDGEQIICTSQNSYHNCKVNINDIQYAYVVINSKAEAMLFLFDHHQNYLPTFYKGFKKVYTELSSLLNFNDEVFFEHVWNKEVLKKEIWRKQHPASYEILESSYDDYDKGFEIQSADKVFISWDASYNDLKHHPLIYLEKSPYDQTLLKFKYPVRLGNILLKDLSAYFDNKRSDIAILDYFTHCIDDKNSDASYYDLKKQLQKDFSLENQKLNYEREDQNNFTFQVKGISFSLVYTYDSQWQFNGGYTSLSIRNQREYPELLNDTAYENKMEITAYLPFSEDLNLTSNYKRDVRVKRRPPNILGEKSSIIWTDEKNGVIGFADKNYSQIFKNEEIAYFKIQNILPAKGAGGAYLEIVLKETKQSLTVLSGKCHVFDKYKKMLAKLTKLDVNSAPEFYDC